MDGCIYRKSAMCEKSKEEDEKRGIRRWCDFYGCEDRHPSNGDRIRAMTDEELAGWLDYISDVLYLPDGTGSWLDWMRQEAEG